MCTVHGQHHSSLFVPKITVGACKLVKTARYKWPDVMVRNSAPHVHTSAYWKVKVSEYSTF